MFNFFTKKQKPVVLNTTHKPLEPVTFYDDEYKIHYQYLGKKTSELK